MLTKSPTERVFLVGVERKRTSGILGAEDSLAELARLAETAGLAVVGQAIQKIDRVNPATLIGKGKVQELGEKRTELLFDTLLFDEELAPNQQRELEEAFEEEVKVLDRTALILDIFAQHARTREGALQVELAQYEYRLPRLTRMWTHLARQTGGAAGRGGTGGVGLRGPGERQLEIDRREIRTRIAHLKRDLEDVRTHRREYRRRRSREGVPVISIVGYTNAGKSTLLNSLAALEPGPRAQVLAENKLFATLDPTTRRARLPKGEDALFTDTVGFIQKLPTQLVAAFRATLEEITESNVLVHVVDVTHPNARAQVQVVEETLEGIGAGDKPVVLALNKWDEITQDDAGDRARIEQMVVELVSDYPEAVRISALFGTGLEELLRAVEHTLALGLARLRVRIPYSAHELVGLFHARGQIDQEESRADGTVIVGRLPVQLLSEFEPYRIDRRH